MFKPLTLNRRQWASVMLAAAATPVFAQAQRPWRFAIVPQFSPLELSKGWAPVMGVLQQVGIACEMVVHPSIAVFEREFLDGSADFVYLNPYHMVMAYQRQKYQALLHDTLPLRGAVVVRKDSPVQTLADLDKQRVSFPAPNAFAASLYVRAVLAREAHVTIRPSYEQTHSNAIRQVLTGDSAAAGIVLRTLAREPAEVQSALRIIYTTPPVTPHPVAAHPRVPVAVRSALTQAFLGMAAHANSKALLSAVQLAQPVVANYAAEYAPLSRLKIEDFVVTI